MSNERLAGRPDLGLPWAESDISSTNHSLPLSIGHAHHGQSTGASSPNANCGGSVSTSQTPGSTSLSFRRFLSNSTAGAAISNNSVSSSCLTSQRPDIAVGLPDCCASVSGCGASSEVTHPDGDIGGNIGGASYIAACSALSVFPVSDQVTSSTGTRRLTNAMDTSNTGHSPPPLHTPHSSVDAHLSEHFPPHNGAYQQSPIYPHPHHRRDSADLVSRSPRRQQHARTHSRLPDFLPDEAMVHAGCVSPGPSVSVALTVAVPITQPSPAAAYLCVRSATSPPTGVGVPPSQMDRFGTPTVAPPVGCLGTSSAVCFVDRDARAMHYSASNPSACLSQSGHGLSSSEATIRKLTQENLLLRHEIEQLRLKFLQQRCVDCQTSHHSLSNCERHEMNRVATELQQANVLISELSTSLMRLCVAAQSPATVAPPVERDHTNSDNRAMMSTVTDDTEMTQPDNSRYSPDYT